MVTFRKIKKGYWERNGECVGIVKFSISITAPKES